MRGDTFNSPLVKCSTPSPKSIEILISGVFTNFANTSQSLLFLNQR